MNEKKQVTSNFLWRFFERCGAQGVSFVVSIILGRLLGPDVYGTVALVTVIINIMQTFVDSGLGNALIQKKDADEMDFSSMFYFNMLVCIALYLLLFLFAPNIADFYHIPQLTEIVRVLGLIIVISGLKNVQQAYVSRNLLFKRFFFATLGGTIVAAAVGILMAYRGYGAWALVIQYLLNSLIDTVILWATVKWKPKKQFSFKRLKQLFGYGWKLLASGLLDKIYNNVYQLIIGKKYSAGDLAFYNKGNSFPSVIVENINSSINSVLFPVMSQRQDSPESVRSLMSRSIKTSSYILMPMMAGLAACSEPLIRLLLTEEWLPAVPFLRMFCFIYAFYPIHIANLNAIKAMGRSDIFLKQEIIKKIVGLVFVAITMWFGVYIMALGLMIGSVIDQIINSWPNKKLLGYSYLSQLRDILPSIVLSGMMGIVVFSIQFLGLPDIVTIFVQVISGAAIYTGASILLKNDSFYYVKSIVASYLKKRTPD